MRALLTGPTAAERRAGFSSTFGATSAGAKFTVRLDRDTATVDFDSSAGDVAKSFEGRASVAQLVATLGQFPEIRYVRVRVSGQPLCRVLDEC